MRSRSFHKTMKNRSIERLRQRGSARIGTLAASAALLALLQGCGGGDGTTASPVAANAAATTAPKASDIVPIGADVRQKVYFAGSTKGFVATALAASLPAGSEGSYDVLVIGDADQGGSATLELARKALEAGKEVVFDAASDGSQRPAHAKTLQALVGTTIDAAAVRVQKADPGYYVTPIDAPVLAMKKLQLASAQESHPSSNSVQSVFGIQNKESAQ